MAEKQSDELRAKVKNDLLRVFALLDPHPDLFSEFCAILNAIMDGAIELDDGIRAGNAIREELAKREQNGGGTV